MRLRCGAGCTRRGNIVTDDQFNALMHDVRKIVYSRRSLSAC